VPNGEATPPADATPPPDATLQGAAPQWSGWQWEPMDWQRAPWTLPDRIGYGNNPWAFSPYEKDTKPYLSHIVFPSYDGTPSRFLQYRYEVTNLKSQCSPQDYKYLAPRLISNFRGSLQEDCQRMELKSGDYQTEDGIERLLKFIQKRINLTDYKFEQEAFEKYFHHISRTKGESIIKYKNEEETAYRRLQKVLNEAMTTGEDEYSSDEDQPPLTDKYGEEIPRFRLPKRLRGWLFLDRAHLPTKELPSIMNFSGNTNIDQLRKVIIESFPDKVIRDIDGRSSSSHKPLHKKKHHPSHYLDDEDPDDHEYADYGDEEYDDDDYYNDEEDEYALDDEDDEEEWTDDEDPDAVAFIDEEGNFYATQEVVDHVDLQNAANDSEYSLVVSNYLAARGALAKARVARGFYPVVVPAGSPPPQFGKGKSKRRRPKGKGKGRRGKSKYSGKSNPPRRPKGRGRGRGRRTTASRQKAKASNQPSPTKDDLICFRCGKKGHISSECTEAPTSKRQRTQDDGLVACEMPRDPETLAEFQRTRRRLWPEQFHNEHHTLHPTCKSCTPPPSNTTPLCQSCSPPSPDHEDDVNVIDHPGCAILDSGATCGVSSLVAADVIQAQRRRYNEAGTPSVSKSDKRFRFGDGGGHDASLALSQPITAGILKGEHVDFHLIDKEGNETKPLLPISEMRKHKMVVDFELNKINFKNQPGVWHTLPTTNRGLLLVPLTQEAVERYHTQDNHHVDSQE